MLSSIHVVQAFAREGYEDRRFEWESRQNVEAGLSARSTKAMLSPTVDIIVAVGTCLVLWYGARLAGARRLDVGVLVAFLWYLGKMYKPMRDLSKMTDTMSKAAVGYERIRAVIEAEDEVRNLPGATKAPRFKGDIELDHVYFAYDNGYGTLSDINLHVAPGQLAALVGPGLNVVPHPRVAIVLDPALVLGIVRPRFAARDSDGAVALFQPHVVGVRVLAGLEVRFL